MWVLETWWFTLASTAISLEAQKLFLKSDDFIVLFILPTRRPTTPARHCQKTSWAALSAACSRERRVPWCCPSNCRVGYMTCYFFIIIIYIYIYIYYYYIIFSYLFYLLTCYLLISIFYIYNFKHFFEKFFIAIQCTEWSKEINLLFSWKIIYCDSFNNEHPEGKNNSDQTYSCPRDWRLSASWEPNWRPP